MTTMEKRQPELDCANALFALANAADLKTKNVVVSPEPSPPSIIKLKIVESRKRNNSDYIMGNELKRTKVQHDVVVTRGENQESCKLVLRNVGDGVFKIIPSAPMNANSQGEKRDKYKKHNAPLFLSPSDLKNLQASRKNVTVKDNSIKSNQKNEHSQSDGKTPRKLRPFRDLATVPDELAFEPLSSDSKRGIPDKPFPSRLYKMIDRAEIDGYSDIIKWCSHGRAFVVLDEKKFLEKVVMRYFLISQYPSFQRQLKVYGFLRLETKFNKVYYHELFLRGRESLCNGIFKKKGATRDVEIPNFDEFPPMHEALKYFNNY